MTTFRNRNRLLRSAAVGAAATATFLLSACGGDTEGPDAGADVQAVQQEQGVAEPGVEDGTPRAVESVDTNFSDVNSYVGQQVTVSADVNDVISPTAFTIAGTWGTTADELLILHRAGAPTVTPDSVVAVTGTVRDGLAISDAEKFVGTDLNDSLFTDWAGEHYIEASSIDPTVSEPAR